MRLRKQHTTMNLEAIPEGHSKTKKKTQKVVKQRVDGDESITSIKIDKDDLTSSDSSSSSEDESKSKNAPK